MKLPALLALCGGASLAGVLLGELLDDDAAAAAAPAPVAGLAVERLERAVDALAARLDAHDAGLRGLEQRMDAAARAEPIPETALRDLVSELLDARLADAPARLAGEEPPRDPAVAAREMLARLEQLDDSEAREFLWQEIRDAGLMDAVLAELEARVERNPTDSELRVALGVAYLQKIQEVGNGPLAGTFATKADQQFDAVLEQDPQHWGARYTKAVALSFWPPIFGKQSEAIEQFEILTQQQMAMPYSSRHGDTWLLLGNMYQQMGQHDAALEAWIEGYELYPDHGDLADKIVDDH